MSLTIQPASHTELTEILAIHRAAFPDEPVAELTAALLLDPSAKPSLSLVALADGRPVGHILFTLARLFPDSSLQCALLAPLAVLPNWQRQGIGGQLVTEGLYALAQTGVDAVFVLGHPAYYPRFGFVPAGCRGFAAPYPIPSQNAAAWMVTGLRGELPEAPAGSTVRCAQALDRREYWLEPA